MKIMPATEMLEEDLPALVETEYQKAKAEYEEDEKEYYRYNAERKKMVKGKMVEKQLRGDSIGELENLQRMLGKMKSNDREKAVSGFIQQLKVNKPKEQQELDLAISDIGTKIRRLPMEKQLDAAKTISDILDQQFQSIENGKKHLEQNHDKRNEDSGEQEQ